MTCATLIDGYNVIFGCGLYGKRATAASLAQARQRLLLEIGRHCGKRADTVSVVFDAQKVPSSAAVEQQNEFGIDVLVVTSLPPLVSGLRGGKGGSGPALAFSLLPRG